MNERANSILAIVELKNNDSRVRYIREPFSWEPDPEAISVDYDMKKLLKRSQEPS